MNSLSQQNEDVLSTTNLPVTGSESIKEVIKETVMNAEAPLMRYFDLGEDSSPNYVLGYN